MNRPAPRIAVLLVVLASVASAAPPSAAWPSQSIYNLPAALIDQAGGRHGLDVYSGHPVLITMFYASCPAACPLLIDTVRSVERALPALQRRQLRVLMISIDPERDTTEALAELSRQRRVDAGRWTLAHTDATTVRKIAAVLNIQYRSLPDGQFNHSSKISLLSPDGEILQQTTLLGRADPDLLRALNALMSQPSRPGAAGR